MHSKVNARKRRRMWLEAMADRSMREGASGIQPAATRETRQPPAPPRREVAVRMPPLPPATSGS